MVLAQKQILRPVKQNRAFRYESKHLCPHYIDNGTKKYDGEKTVSSTNDSGKSSYLPAEN
jgi:hypothetical protein